MWPRVDGIDGGHMRVEYAFWSGCERRDMTGAHGVISTLVPAPRGENDPSGAKDTNSDAAPSVCIVTTTLSAFAIWPGVDMGAVDLERQIFGLSTDRFQVVRSCRQAQDCG